VRRYVDEVIAERVIAPEPHVFGFCGSGRYTRQEPPHSGRHGISVGERPGHATDLYEFLLERCDDVGSLRRSGPDFIRRQR
jgi:hypothetical protein